MGRSDEVTNKNRRALLFAVPLPGMMISGGRKKWDLYAKKHLTRATRLP
jgi:hypothetical protein